MKDLSFHNKHHPHYLNKSEIGFKDKKYLCLIIVTIMNIEAKKLELMHLLLQTEKESILLKLKRVFDEEQGDWWNEMSQEEQEEIKEGLAQADTGDCIANETVMKRFDKWH